MKKYLMILGYILCFTGGLLCGFEHYAWGIIITFIGMLLVFKN